jgi:hypothetical protein
MRARSLEAIVIAAIQVMHLSAPILQAKNSFSLRLARIVVLMCISATSLLLSCDAVTIGAGAGAAAPGDQESAGDAGSSGNDMPQQGETGAGSDATVDDDDGVIAALLRDSDGDGTKDIDEIHNWTDPLDATEGGDLDDDGIPNRDDADVDGDGLNNGEDPDADGDGIANGEDDDVDGDGLLAQEDEDDDGDGTDDDEDEDKNGDGKTDCECKHGVCSAFKGLCFCERGWEGEECDEFHCRDIRTCNNGTCVGPNTCRCNAGWENIGSVQCAVYHCRGVRNCSGHGQCVGPDECECDVDWKGSPDCSRHTCTAVPVRCDDGDPCTIDTCDPAAGCEHEPLVCPLFEECVSGQCTDPCRSAADCADGEGCRDGGCFPCEDDAECRDGDPCTVDLCEDAGCTNEPLSCSILEECVLGKCVESCVEDGDCADSQSCREGGCFEDCAEDNDCDDVETCNDGSCVPEDQEENGDEGEGD